MATSDANFSVEVSLYINNVCNKGCASLETRVFYRHGGIPRHVCYKQHNYRLDTRVDMEDENTDNNVISKVISDLEAIPVSARSYVDGLILTELNDMLGETEAV